MKPLPTIILAGALALLMPISAIAQTTTTGSAGCTVITQSAANAAATRIANGDSNIPQPNSVKNLTCLSSFFNGTGLNVVNNLLNPTTLLNSIVTQICTALKSEWQKLLGSANCGITLTSFKLGFLGGLGSGLSCPRLSFGGGGPPIGTIGVGNGRLYTSGQALTPTSYALTNKFGLF
jgi:hypothetical protein